MTLPPITPEFLLVAIAVGVGASLGCYFAGRHNRVHADYAFIVRELEGTEMDRGNLEQLNFDDAIQQRNEVLDAVADNSSGWLKLALEAMKRIPDGTERTGEGFRVMLLEGGLPDAPHANSWGALTGTLSRRGILVATGDWQPMKQKSSHGRLTRVYTKRTPEAA